MTTTPPVVSLGTPASDDWNLIYDGSPFEPDDIAIISGQVRFQFDGLTEPGLFEDLILLGWDGPGYTTAAGGVLQPFTRIIPFP